MRFHRIHELALISCLLLSASAQAAIDGAAAADARETRAREFKLGQFARKTYGDVRDAIRERAQGLAERQAPSIFREEEVGGEKIYSVNPRLLTGDGRPTPALVHAISPQLFKLQADVRARRGMPEDAVLSARIAMAPRSHTGTADEGVLVRFDESNEVYTILPGRGVATRKTIEMPGLEGPLRFADSRYSLSNRSWDPAMKFDADRSQAILINADGLPRVIDSLSETFYEKFAKNGVIDQELFFEANQKVIFKNADPTWTAETVSAELVFGTVSATDPKRGLRETLPLVIYKERASGKILRAEWITRSINSGSAAHDPSETEYWGLDRVAKGRHELLDGTTLISGKKGLTIRKAGLLSRVLKYFRLLALARRSPETYAKSLRKLGASGEANLSHARDVLVAVARDYESKNGAPYSYGDLLANARFGILHINGKAGAESWLGVALGSEKSADGEPKMMYAVAPTDHPSNGEEGSETALPRAITVQELVDVKEALAVVFDERPTGKVSQITIASPAAAKE